MKSTKNTRGGVGGGTPPTIIRKSFVYGDAVYFCVAKVTLPFAARERSERQTASSSQNGKKGSKRPFFDAPSGELGREEQRHVVFHRAVGGDAEVFHQHVHHIGA